MEKAIFENNELPPIGIEILTGFLSGIEITQLADTYSINDEGIEDIIRQTLKGYFRKTKTSVLINSSQNQHFRNA